MPTTYKKKKKRNIWADPSPYGTYEGERGNPSQWRSTFNERFTREEVEAILDADDPYVILGLTNLATIAEIKTAYRKLMFIHHPDKGGDVEKAKKIIAAYQYLTN
jgi:DnaJ-class molecular chaperone